MLRRMLAIAALGAVALIATPLAAQAEEGYNAQGPQVTEFVGVQTTLTFTGFPPNTPATAVADDAVTLSIIRATTFTRPTDADGSVAFTAASDVPGTYEITVTAGGVIGVGQLTVVPPDSPLPTAGPVAPDDGNNLPDTGLDLPVLWLWLGGGAVALGAALIVVLAKVRRSRNEP